MRNLFKTADGFSAVSEQCPIATETNCLRVFFQSIENFILSIKAQADIVSSSTCNVFSSFLLSAYDYR